MSDSERQQYLATIAALTGTIDGLRTELAAQSERHDLQLQALNDKLDAALRRLHGRSSERQRRVSKMPSPDAALAAKGVSLPLRRPEPSQSLAEVAVDGGSFEHAASPADMICKSCGDGAAFHAVGLGKESTLYDYVPGYFRRTQHRVSTVACRCGSTIMTAKGPDRATPKSKFGPGVAAWLVTQKCSLSTPI